MLERTENAPTFHPSLRTLKEESFGDYVTSVERSFAKEGICKIKAPKGWTPRKAGYPEDLDLEIPRAIRQTASGKAGLFRAALVEQKPMSLLHNFKPFATDKLNTAPAADLEDLENPDKRDALERRYWKNVSINPPLYGADVPGSLFDESLQGWNIRRLDSLLSKVLANQQLPGVNTPYLYFGMFRSTFAWHTEDMDLHSVNYLHFGAPKMWYCIAPKDRERFERAVANEPLLREHFQACPEFFRHKELLISPQRLASFGIPFRRVVQYPGEFVVTYPGAYHFGFNLGYNCAESTNFATKAWIPIGAKAKFCGCTDDSVRLDMSLFLKVANSRGKQVLREQLARRDAAQQSAETSASESPSDGSDSEDEVLSESSETRPSKPFTAAGPKRKRAASAPVAATAERPAKRPATSRRKPAKLLDFETSAQPQPTHPKQVAQQTARAVSHHVKVQRKTRAAPKAASAAAAGTAAQAATEAARRGAAEGRAARAAARAAAGTVAGAAKARRAQAVTLKVSQQGTGKAGSHSIRTGHSRLQSQAHAHAQAHAHQPASPKQTGPNNALQRAGGMLTRALSIFGMGQPAAPSTPPSNTAQAKSTAAAANFQQPFGCAKPGVALQQMLMMAATAEGAADSGDQHSAAQACDSETGSMGSSRQAGAAALRQSRRLSGRAM